MSEPMKKLPIDTKEKVEIIISGRKGFIPVLVAENLLKEYFEEETIQLEDFKKEFPDWKSNVLKAAREKAGLSQTLLSSKTGISQANISSMENGRRAIGKEIAKKLAKVFGSDYRIFL